MRVEVTDPDDPRIAVYLGLRDHAERQRRERPGGDRADTFVAEGDIVIERALAAGQRLRSVLVSARRTKPLPALPEAVTVLSANDAVLTAITGRPELRDPLACFTRPEPLDAEAVIRSAQRLAVLVGLNNPNNLGVIMRNAAGLGIDGVLLDSTCGDPLYRRAIRASMGQVFSVPFARFDRFDDVIAVLGTAAFETVALTPGADTDLRDLAPPERCAIVLGAEGPGLPAAVINAADHRIKIDMSNDVDSLNVANAAAVAFWALTAPER